MSGEAPHILIVEDDARLRDLLRKYLVEQGFRTTAAPDAATARAHMGSVAFDMLVLDVMMPGENGLDLTEDIRRTSDVPILLLTAMGEADDRISGLERGADDYVVKPFEARELVLRINAILRRAPSAVPAAPEIRFGPFRFDLKREELYGAEGRIRLTSSETALLALLARNANNAVARQEASDEREEAARAVDVQMTRLRRKVEPDPRFPRYLVTVRGKGYMLRSD
ncbi:MAG: response regulator [Alphaproteobacteria bacterium]|nr:response regulator [Alphaproteobacteria bacterium]